MKINLFSKTKMSGKAGNIIYEGIGQELKSYKWSVDVQLPVSYTVVESTGLFTLDNQDLISGVHTRYRQQTRRFVVVDQQVDKLYGDSIRKYFQHYEVEHCILPLCVSEQNKTMETVFQIFEQLDAFRLYRRHEPIIAVGGGVLLDIVGLAASLYRRGIPYIRVPTTLMALVDAGIGAKTGVNFQAHKNRIGTYYPPLTTFIDRSFLKTLDDRHICNGLAEILKIGIVKDKELFELLDSHATSLITEKLQSADVPIVVIRRAIQGMLEELEPNLWEHKLDRLVDFGHSFSPTVEMRALPKLLHGEAVAMDMAFSSVIACQRGLLSPINRDRVLKVIKLLRLPIIHPLYEASLLYKALQETVRHRDGLQRLPLPTDIGSANFFNDITFQEIETAVCVLKQLAKEK